MQLRTIHSEVSPSLEIKAPEDPLGLAHPTVPPTKALPRMMDCELGGWAAAVPPAPTAD